MRLSFKFPYLLASLIVAFVMVVSASAAPDAKAESPTSAKLLASRIAENNVATASPQPSTRFADERLRTDFLITDAARRAYRHADGTTFTIDLVRARTSAAAYALLTAEVERMRRETNAQPTPIDGIGTYAFSSDGTILFSRDDKFVRLETTGDAPSSAVVDAARAFDSVLAKDGNGEDIPVLVRHLPDWRQAQQNAVYAVSLGGLQEAVGRQPILEGYDFSGGAEAVVAPYATGGNAPTRLVIVEHFTPQHAADNERYVNRRAEELRASGANVPMHKRVGNYMVFAFDAPNEEAAKSLVGQVKYEQDVRWLGDNPFAQARAEREYTMMSLGVILASLKSAGLGVLLCLGVGTIAGSLIFMRRRAQSASAATYSDAGGMVRLGIDNLTPQQEDAARLLTTSKK